jgi:hypothetical protein
VHIKSVENFRDECHCIFFMGCKMLHPSFVISSWQMRFSELHSLLGVFVSDSWSSGEALGRARSGGRPTSILGDFSSMYTYFDLARLITSKGNKKNPKIAAGPCCVA